MSDFEQEEHTPEEPLLNWIYYLKKRELLELNSLWRLGPPDTVENLRLKVRSFFLNHSELWTVASDISVGETDMANMEEGTKAPAAVIPPLAGATTMYPPDYTLQFFSSLKFDNSSSLSPYDFLQRVNEKRKACRVSKEVLLAYLPELLDGTPLQWYRLEIDNWHSWEDFEASFRTTFFPPNYQEKLKKEIERRTQGEQEKVLDFAINIRTLCKRLTHPPPEAEVVSTIYNNLLPRYQLYIRRSEATSVGRLVELGQELERIEERAKTFRPPPSKARSMVPEAAYLPPQTSSGSSRKVSTVAMVEPTPKIKDKRKYKGSKNKEKAPDNRQESSAVTRIIEDNSNLSLVQSLCWNCLNIGHRYPECSKPRTILFCYHCGTRGITRKNCPNCTQRGNDQRASLKRSPLVP
uniref:CCHC-type domain-containing protein n=1 Tax=Rhodnius prolixus TaxID=13249 RepID=T1HAE7_RHOPR